MSTAASLTSWIHARPTRCEGSGQETIPAVDKGQCVWTVWMLRPQTLIVDRQISETVRRPVEGMPEDLGSSRLLSHSLSLS